MSTHKLLDDQWQQWIRLNLQRNCRQEDMLQAMMNAGITAEVARYNLDQATQTPAVATPAYEIEGSYLFQHENDLRTSDGQVIHVAMRIENPDIVLLDNFMSAEECDTLCALANQRLTPSTVVDDATGEGIDHEHRTSQGMSFALAENALVATLERRITEITGIPEIHGEGIQILNYACGGEYRPHFDYFTDTEGGRANLVHGGQRIITIVMYLNDVEAGGATIFPELNLSVFPKKGSALYFSYFNHLQQVNPATLHGGAPVVTGEKWIATKWIRQHPYV